MPLTAAASRGSATRARRAGARQRECRKRNETRKARLKLSREIVILLATTKLGGVQGGDTAATRGIGLRAEWRPPL
jgi:hypothetical protein